MLPFMVAMALIALVGAAFAPTLANDFVNWDDAYNFLNNYAYRGLDSSHIAWAFTTRRLGVYQPLAWVLLEIQYVLFGLRASGYHLVSLVLHGANVLLLLNVILKLRRRFSAEGVLPSELFLAGIVCGIFALHPLRVEAVAWVSCQPYLLCLMFLLLSLSSYIDLMGSSALDRGRPKWRIILPLFWYVCACLSKATAVSWPILLLAVDYLRVRGSGGAWKIWPELKAKVPYFVMAALTAVVAVWARAEIHQGPNVAHVGLWERLAYGDYAVFTYLSKTLWPVNLSNYYAKPELSNWATMIALVVAPLALGTLWRMRVRYPEMLLGFVMALAAVGANLGLFQIGSTVASDRYTYVATASFIVVVAFGTTVWRIARLPASVRGGVYATMGMAIVLLVPATRLQSQVWRNSLSLWQDALSKGGDRSEDVYNNLGLALSDSGDLGGAVQAYEQAIRLNPGYSLAHTNLGILLVKQGAFDRAGEVFSAALKLDPESVEALNGYAYVNFLKGDLATARQFNAKALALRPDDPSNLELNAQILSRSGELQAALEAAQKGVRLDPNHASLLNTLGAVQFMLGDLLGARDSYARALQVQPQFIEALVNLGDTLKRLGDEVGAEAQYQKAAELRGTVAGEGRVQR